MSWLGRPRNIRPRPINFEERIPVVWLSRKRAAGAFEVEPALEHFLRSSEAEHAEEHGHRHGNGKVRRHAQVQRMQGQHACLMNI